MKKSGRYISHNVSSALFGMALVACASTSPLSSDVDVALVRLTPNPSQVSLAARLEGALAVQKGCVYLFSALDGAPLLVLWPSTYRLWQSNGRTKGVLDTATGRSLEFGVQAAFAGNKAKHVMASELEAPIPPACDGPAVYAEFSSV